MGRVPYMKWKIKVMFETTNQIIKTGDSTSIKWECRGDVIRNVTNKSIHKVYICLEWNMACWKILHSTDDFPAFIYYKGCPIATFDDGRLWHLKSRKHFFSGVNRALAGWTPNNSTGDFGDQPIIVRGR